MNAVSNSTTEFMEESGNGSDSDTNPDETPEYYQPISAVEDEDSDQRKIAVRMRWRMKRREIAEDLDSAVLRAFREDESRRNALLLPENATRVMEAMRGVSFGGVAPDWAGQFPEDQWIDRLRRLRQPPQDNSTSVQN
uniref:Uncharacterized protein n=1 Tax=Fagus sylvatica TaxID=28930 RepID=A0A2N9IP73_FAGSY